MNRIKPVKTQIYSLSSFHIKHFSHTVWLSIWITQKLAGKSHEIFLSGQVENNQTIRFGAEIFFHSSTICNM